MFLWNSLAVYMIQTHVGNLISHSSPFSKSSLNIWNFLLHVLLKPGSENFDHYFASVWDECNCVVVWKLFGIAFLWDWNENCLLGFQIVQLEFHHLNKLCSWWCFLRLTWLPIPGCLALISYHITCLPRKLYAGQEATVRTGHETTDWFQIGKGVHQDCIL